MPNIQLASSLAAVKPSQIRAIADVAFGMEGVLRLQFGESNLSTPDYIKAAATQALADGYTFYTENAGLPGLRRSIAAKYQQLHQVEIDPATELVITASGVQALNVAIRCVVDPGDEAIILTPNWPNATAIVGMFGAIPKEIPYKFEADRIVVDFEAIEAALTPKTKLLVYTSPSNPLGWVATLEEQQQLLDFCRRRGLWLMADEVYERLYYGGQVAPSILRLCTRDDAVIVVQSFSKTYNMTGWRLGWVVSRKDLAQKAAQLNEFIISHASSMVQRAGEFALQHGDDQVQAMVEELHQKMTFCHSALSSIRGVSLPRPGGAFYLFPQIAGLSDSFAFALNFLKEHKVAVAPGVAFGNGGEGAIRLCFATDQAILEPALERLRHFIEQGAYV